MLTVFFSALLARPARRLALFATLLVGGASACDRAAPADTRAADSAAQAAAQAEHVRDVAAAGGVVDSIMPMAEQLRRFREGLPVVDSLQRASPSLDALVARLAKALASRDTADLNAMVLDRAEFAYIYFPTSTLSRPPYEAPPQLVWGQILSSSNAGLGKLMERFGGAAVEVHDLQCPAPTDTAGVRSYERCTVRFTAPGRRALAGNLFGTVVSQGARYKFLGFANRI